MTTTSFLKRISVGLAATFAGVASLCVSIHASDPAPPPTVQIFAADPAGAETGSDPAKFIVLRLGATNTPLTVAYSVGGTAVRGEDYENPAGRVTIPAGEYFAPIPVVPLDDFQVEGWEHVVVALDQPPTWPPPYWVDWPSVAVAYIEDNDLSPVNPPPQVGLLSPPDGAVFPAPTDIFLLAQASDPDGHVTSVEFFDGTNSLGVVFPPPWPPIVAFPGVAGDGTVEMPSPDDMAGIDEPLVAAPRRLFRLVWHNPPVGTHVLRALATDNQQASTWSEPARITVYEAPAQTVVTVVATDPEASEVVPSGTHVDTGAFTVSRKGPTDRPLRVWYRLTGSATNGEDYSDLPSSVVIPREARSAEISVKPIDDLLVEGDESVVVTLLPPLATDPLATDDYLLGRPYMARLVLHDNDAAPNHPPAVRITRPIPGAAYIAPATVLIVAQAFDIDGLVVSVEFFEGTNSLGVVKAPAATATAVSARPAFIFEWTQVPPGDYVLSAVATDDGGATGQSRPVEITVLPPTRPPVVQIETTDGISSEPGVLTVIDDATLKVTRTGATERPLIVFYAVAGTAESGIDYTRLSGRVAIPIGAADANIVIHPLHDLLVEGPEVVNVKIEPAPFDSAGSSVIDYYIVGPNHEAKALIRDNDEPPSNLSPKAAIVRPQDGDVFTAPAEIPIVVAATDPDGLVVSVEFFEGTNSLGIVTVDPHAVNTDQTFWWPWSNVPAGIYKLSAVATDDDGATVRTEPVEIRVVGLTPPVITLAALDAWASEGPMPNDGSSAGSGGGSSGPGLNTSDPAVFAVHRTGSTDLPLTVFYNLGGTASNGRDYKTLDGKVVIPRGAADARILIEPIDDDQVEGLEIVVAKLNPVDCCAVFPPPPDCYIVGEPASASACIRDNDRNLSPKAEILAPADNAVFVKPADIEIQVLTVDPDGWVPKLQFYADGVLIGEREMVFIMPPSPGEPQTFTFTWTGAPVGRHVLTARAIDNLRAVGVTDPVRMVVLAQSPLPIVTIEATQPITQEQDPRINTPNPPAVFKVARLGGDLTRALRVSYRIGGTATNGVDYQPLPGEVVLDANETSAAIQLHPIDDNLVEGTEFVLLALVQPDSVSVDPEPPADAYIVGVPGRALASIRDNDVPNLPPRVALIEPANGDLFLAPVDIDLGARAADADGWVHTVEFFANGVSLGTVTNSPWIVESTRLPDLNGAVLPGLEAAAIPIPPPVKLTWPNVVPGNYTLTSVATDNDGASTRSAPVMIHVLEQTHPPVVTVFALDGFAREGTTNTALFSIRRVGPVQNPLKVHFRIEGTAINGVDYGPITSPAEIPAGRHSIQVPVLPIDDRVTESPETVVLSLEPSPLDVFPPPYVIGVPDMAGALIVDNDHLIQQMTRSVGDDSLHIRLPLARGLPYRLEASFNLIDWEPVSQGIGVEEDGIDYVETGKSQHPQRFYRMVPELKVDPAGD
jgi:hypothetical protein